MDALIQLFACLEALRKGHSTPSSQQILPWRSDKPLARVADDPKDSKGVIWECVKGLLVAVKIPKF